MLFPLAKVHISPSKHQELHFTKNSHFHSEAQKEFTKSLQKTHIPFFISDLNAFCKKKTFIDFASMKVKRIYLNNLLLNRTPITASKKKLKKNRDLFVDRILNVVSL